MEYNSQVWEMLERSQHIDIDQLSQSHPKDIGKAPINSNEFDRLEERLIVTLPASDAVNFVREKTEQFVIEYSLMLYGKTVDSNATIVLKDFYLAEGSAAGASFSRQQRSFTRKVLKEWNSEAIYGHTHVARSNCYNCFSVDDLAYLTMRAINTQRNTYGLLITREQTIAIKFDLARCEFYRVNIEVH